MTTWLEDIIKAFINIGGKGSYSDLYREIKKIRKEPLPVSWQAIIRNAIETHSSDSDNWNGRNNIFESIGGIGSGFWGLRRQWMPIEKKPTEKLNELISTIDTIDQEATTRKLREVNQINRNIQYVNKLKKLYNYKCQICSKEIILRNGVRYAEVHHLKPLGENGPDIIENMIVVCPNCHVQLDYKSLKIDLKNINIIEPHKIDSKYLYKE